MENLNISEPVKGVFGKMQGDEVKALRVSAPDGSQQVLVEEKSRFTRLRLAHKLARIQGKYIDACAENYQEYLYANPENTDALASVRDALQYNFYGVCYTCLALKRLTDTAHIVTDDQCAQVSAVLKSNLPNVGEEACKILYQ